MSRPGWVIVVLGAVLACQAPASLETPEPPGDVRFLAALAFDPQNDRLVGTSAIVERLGAWRVDLELEEADPNSADVVLVGWTHALRPEAVPAPGALGALRAATGCETRVPQPTWRLGLQGEESMAWPALTTDKLSEVCPALVPPGTSEPLHLCGRNYCGQAIHQDACAIEIRSAGCGLERSITRGVVDAYGGLCFSAEEGCESVRPRPNVFRRIECKNPELCEIDWVRASTSTPPLRILRRELVSEVAPASEALILQPTDALVGPLQELLVGEAGLVALHRPGVAEPFGRGASASRLLILDPSSLEITRAVDLPAGVGAVDWAPDQLSLVAVQLNGPGNEHAVLRLSPQGELLERHPFQLPVSGFAIAIQPFRRVPELDVFVAFVSAPEGERALVTIEPTTLQVQTACVPSFGLGIADFLPLLPDQIWISDNNSDYLPRVSVGDCRLTGSVQMEVAGNFGMGFFLRAPGPANTVFLTLGGLSANAISRGQLVDGGTFPSRGASYYESFMIPTRLEPSPAHPGLALAALHSRQNEEPARVAWFDLEAELFRLGSADIGRGIVARMRTRGDGVFYLLMGRAGAVVRVDTR